MSQEDQLKGEFPTDYSSVDLWHSLLNDLVGCTDRRHGLADQQAIAVRPLRSSISIRAIDRGPMEVLAEWDNKCALKRHFGCMMSLQDEVRAKLAGFLPTLRLVKSSLSP